jgi:hypothetical protein
VRQANCHGLDKLWKWNVCVCVNICMNDGALRAVKKLYIRLCAARDTNIERRGEMNLLLCGIIPR